MMISEIGYEGLLEQRNDELPPVHEDTGVQVAQGGDLTAEHVHTQAERLVVFKHYQVFFQPGPSDQSDILQPKESFDFN